MGHGEFLGLGAHLLWSPVVETLQLFLPPSLMPSIKYWYLKVCAWHSPHVGKLSTDVVVPFLQILHGTLLRIKTWGEGWKGHSEACGRDGMKVLGLLGLGVRRTCKCTPPAHLELLVVIPVMDNYKTKVKAPAEIKEVVSFCFSPSVVMKIELVLLL